MNVCQSIVRSPSGKVWKLLSKWSNILPQLPQNMLESPLSGGRVLSVFNMKRVLWTTDNDQKHSKHAI